MKAIKGIGIWIGGAIGAFLLMYMFGAGRGNPASLVFVGYILLAAAQLFVVSTNAFQNRRTNPKPPHRVIADTWTVLTPLYLAVTAVLLFDSVFNTQLGQNIWAVLAIIAAAWFLIERDNNRTDAGDRLRGGRANEATEDTQRTKGPRGRYANIPQHDDVVDAGQPVQRLIVTAAPEPESEYEQWARTASPEDLEAVRLQAERNEQEERAAQKPKSRYAHLKDEEG